ncbi:MAG: hypothetical protein ABSG69_18755 [Candidatus Acidiferrum sp.]
MPIEKSTVRGRRKKLTPGKGKMQVSAPQGKRVSSMKTLNIGSQSSGSGAGKITFNPFSIVKK